MDMERSGSALEARLKLATMRKSGMEGFIKVWRRMLDSEVMKDDWLCRLWMWCMMKAQWRQVDRKGVPDRGQFYTGRITGSSELGVSPSKWYRGIERLRELGCIEIEADSNRTTITICNYATYQDSVDESEQQSDSKRTASEQPSLIEEGKKERKGAKNRQGFDPLTTPKPSPIDTPAFSEVWSEWIAYRRERRLSIREAVIGKQLNFLANFGSAVAIQVIEASIRNGWQGLFEPKHSPGKQQPESPANCRPLTDEEVLNLGKPKA